MSPTTFLHLPGELRNMIYKYAVEGATVRFTTRSPGIRSDFDMPRDLRDAGYITLYERYRIRSDDRLALADFRSSIVFACFQTYIESRMYWLQELNIATQGIRCDEIFDRCCPRTWRPYITTINSLAFSYLDNIVPRNLPNLRSFHISCQRTSPSRNWETMLFRDPPISHPLAVRIMFVQLATALLRPMHRIDQELTVILPASRAASIIRTDSLDAIYRRVKAALPENTTIELTDLTLTGERTVTLDFATETVVWR